jgi:hypothetical protein
MVGISGKSFSVDSPPQASAASSTGEIVSLMGS